MTDDITLSVVLCGRNDDYLGDFKYRIASAINYLVRSAYRAGCLADMEINVVDWNSDTPLSAELDLIPQAVQAANFLAVPPETASKYNGRAEFNANCALNVGVRRSQGRYIMIMPADILVTRPAIQNLLQLLGGGFDTEFDPSQTMLNIGRMLVPWQVVSGQPSLSEWDRYIQLNTRHLFYDNTYHGLCGGYGAILMHRKLWEHSQGFLESYGGWGGSDVELSLRVHQEHAHVDLLSFGIYVFDMQENPAHQLGKITGAGYSRHMRIPGQMHLGNKDWGLRGIDVKTSHTKVDGMPPQLERQPDNQPAIQNRNDLFNALVKNYFLKALFASNGSLPSGNEWACLYPLAWFCATRHPRRYLEFGDGNHHAALVAGSLCDSLEIYGIGLFSSMQQAEDLSYRLYRQRYRGYSRFITGSTANAINRLNGSFMGSPSFDLILYRTDPLGIKGLRELITLFYYLEPGGMLIVTGKQRQLFKKIWRRLQQEWDGFTLLACSQHHTGVLLKSKPAAGIRRPNDGREESVLAAAWRKPGWVSPLHAIALALRPAVNSIYERLKAV